jgi:hypothetical protein
MQHIILGAFAAFACLYRVYATLVSKYASSRMLIYLVIRVVVVYGRRIAGSFLGGKRSLTYTFSDGQDC